MTFSFLVVDGPPAAQASDITSTQTSEGLETVRDDDVPGMVESTEASAVPSDVSFMAEMWPCSFATAHCEVRFVKYQPVLMSLWCVRWLVASHRMVLN